MGSEAKSSVGEFTDISQMEEVDLAQKLDEAQKVILALKESMEEEAAVLQQERSEFESVRKKLDSVHFKKHIKLNVGGQIFKTSLETLKKDENSMLASMFSGRFEILPDKEDDAYFIDRDGTHFRYILNYLRTGRLIFPKQNKILAAELLLEAEFYQISGMPKEIWQGPEILNSSYIFLSLNSAQKDTLLSWIPTPDLCYWNQLFTASNGWFSVNFHTQCNDKGPTIVLARVGNYIFGGYAHAPWNSSYSFIEDASCFLFVLANPTGAPPTKLSRSAGGGIWCNPSCGPCFGTSSGTTISFMNAANTSACGVNNSYGGFECPAGQNFVSFIHGNTASNMNYMEVFGLKDAY